MPLAESRAQVTLVEDAIIEAGDYQTFLDSKDERIKGELSKNGAEAVKNSTLDEVKSAKEAVKDAANKINDAKNKMNNALTGLTPEKMLNQMFGNTPSILNPVSEVYGVFKTVLCWDGNIDFSIRDLIDALTLDFNFLYTWSICQRQGAVNPINNLLNSVKRMEGELNDLTNIGPRILNNLKRGIKGFIQKSGLPVQLQRCMLQSSFLKNAYKYNNNISLSAITNMLEALDASICSQSAPPLTNSVGKSMEKVSMSPFVEGLRDYNRDMAIGSIVSLAANPEIDTDVLHAALVESFHDEPTKSGVLLLEMIAVTKGYGQYDLPKQDSLAVGDITSLLVNSSDLNRAGASNSVIDAALSNIADGSKDKNQELNKALSGIRSEHVYIPKLDAEIFFKNMKDDYTLSKTPKEDLDRIKKLLPVGIDGFKAEENINTITHSETIMTLQSMTNQMTTGVKEITNKKDTVGKKSLDCLELQPNNDPYFQSFLVSETRKQLEA